MTTTELDTTIAGVEATLSALEQAHARQVGTLQQELAALTAQRCAVYRGMLFGPPDRYRGTLFGPPDGRR